MANGHGGKRPGAGRPRKPLAEKILDGNPGKRKPKVLNIPEMEAPSLEPPEYISSYVGRRGGKPDATEIYAETAKWLDKTGCLHLINPAFIMEYAVLKSRWLECEFIVSTAIMVKDKKEEVVPNPMVETGLKYLRAADAAWDKIWSVVAQNSEVYFGSDPNSDVMAVLLRNKPER
jgi:hypothetical protein